jgi:hypothetical protein
MVAPKETGTPNINNETGSLDWRFGKERAYDTYLKRLKPGEDLIKSTDINELRSMVEALWNHEHMYHDDAIQQTVQGSSTTTCG